MFFATKGTKYFVSLLMLLAVVLVGTQSASAVESGGIGGRPANPDPANPRTESIFVFNVDAGQKAENSVKVFNNSSAKKTIDIYAVDSQVSSGGTFACAQRVEEKKAAGSWISLDKSSVTLDPGKSEEVHFDLDVPGNAPGGEHNACIAIQEANQTPQAAGNGIALSFRSAIRVAVTVKGDIKKELSFSKLQSSKGKDSKRVVNAALRNTGNVSLDTDIDVRIKSILGTTVRKTGGEFPVLANGESEFNLETAEPFWGGVYFLTATASYNADPSAPLGTKDKTAKVSQTKILLTSPKPLALVIEIIVPLLLVAAGVLYYKRHHHRRKWHREGKIYIVKDGDTLPHIAQKFGVSWKAIAGANNLKAPYHVAPGDRLKILPKVVPAKDKKVTS